MHRFQCSQTWFDSFIMWDPTLLGPITLYIVLAQLTLHNKFVYTLNSPMWRQLIARGILAARADFQTGCQVNIYVGARCTYGDDGSPKLYTKLTLEVKKIPGQIRPKVQPGRRRPWSSRTCGNIANICGGLLDPKKHSIRHT